MIIAKHIKILKGIYYTYFKKSKPYNYSFWDNDFYNEITDSNTIAPNNNIILTKYHYSSIELIILRYLFNNKIDLKDKSLLDIGSGAGHWIEFYNKLGIETITGIDVSKKSIDYLSSKYNFRFINGNISSLKNGKYDIINAIGVMFHIIDDNEWKYTINNLIKKLNPGGILIISGHFGVLNNINTQYYKDMPYKRIRSRNNWKRNLKGLSKIEFITNKAYLKINDTIPENNILIAVK